MHFWAFLEHLSHWWLKGEHMHLSSTLLGAPPLGSSCRDQDASPHLQWAHWQCWNFLFFSQVRWSPFTWGPWWETKVFTGTQTLYLLILSSLRSWDMGILSQWLELSIQAECQEPKAGIKPGKDLRTTTTGFTVDQPEGCCQVCLKYLSCCSQ